MLREGCTLQKNMIVDCLSTRSWEDARTHSCVTVLVKHSTIITLVWTQKLSTSNSHQVTRTVPRTTKAAIPIWHADAYPDPTNSW